MPIVMITGTYVIATFIQILFENIPDIISHIIKCFSIYFEQT